MECPLCAYPTYAYALDAYIDVMIADLTGRLAIVPVHAHSISGNISRAQAGEALPILILSS
jgi:hypothetical protein